MPLHVKVGTKWYNSKAWIKVSGAWKNVLNIYTKVSGAWKKLWTYSWDTSDTWSSCSKTCGSGTQTRAVPCKRSDGITVTDAFCTAYGAGTKPATSKACNTQECTDCRGPGDGYSIMNTGYITSDEDPTILYIGDIRWGSVVVCSCHYATSPITSCNYGGYSYWLGNGGIDYGQVCRKPV